MEIFKLLSITLGAILVKQLHLLPVPGLLPLPGRFQEGGHRSGHGRGRYLRHGSGLRRVLCGEQVSSWCPWIWLYMQTVAFILVIAALVQFIEMFLQKAMPALYTALGVYLPLITTNCAVLGVVLLNVQNRLQLHRVRGLRHHRRSGLPAGHRAVRRHA